MIRLGIIIAACAAPAWADVKPAPQYFIDAVFASTAAQQVALLCPSLSIDPVSAQKQSETILSKLEAQGFDLTAQDLGMGDISDPVAAKSAAFMEAHGLAGAGPDQACAAGTAEIAAKSDIGALLLEVAQ